MSDDKKKKKLDAKRFALGQKWERAYVKKKAKELIEIIKEDKSKYIYFTDYKKERVIKFASSSAIRICQACLKAIEHYEKK